eukprot:1160266-Pelagomonas_calceolata.AAC.5
MPQLGNKQQGRILCAAGFSACSWAAVAWLPPEGAAVPAAAAFGACPRGGQLLLFNGFGASPFLPFKGRNRRDSRPLVPFRSVAAGVLVVDKSLFGLVSTPPEYMINLF